MNENYFSEVIESSLQNWTAQSWNWNEFPDFGSIVVVKNNNKKIYAVVYQIQTGSIDSFRQPIAYGKTEEELKKEQPQIFEFLRTTFSCLVLGYQEDDKIFYQLASQPAKIHSFIRKASDDEIKIFFKSAQYMQVIFAYANKILNLDELILALIRNIKRIKNFEKDELDEFVEIYSLLTGNDYARLKLFLQRI